MKNLNTFIQIFDVESLLTNVALQETIDLCFQNLFGCKNYIDGLSKDSFHEMLTVTTIEFFTFRSRRPEMLLWRNIMKNMKQIYRKTPTLKCDVNKVALQLYWNHFWHGCSSVSLMHIFRTPLHKNTSGWLLLYFI